MSSQAYLISEVDANCFEDGLELAEGNDGLFLVVLSLVQLHKVSKVLYLLKKYILHLWFRRLFGIVLFFRCREFYMVRVGCMSWGSFFAMTSAHLIIIQKRRRLGLFLSL